MNKNVKIAFVCLIIVWQYDDDVIINNVLSSICVSKILYSKIKCRHTLVTVGSQNTVDELTKTLMLYQIFLYLQHEQIDCQLLQTFVQKFQKTT